MQAVDKASYKDARVDHSKKKKKRIKKQHSNLTNCSSKAPLSNVIIEEKLENEQNNHWTTQIQLCFPDNDYLGKTNAILEIIVLFFIL